MPKQDLYAEYNKLDEKLTRFRKQWNRKAREDIQYSLVHHISKGKQEDFPDWWYVDVERWRELKSLLNIR